MLEEEVHIPARDGYDLAATHLAPPEGQTREPFVVLSPAMGVPRQFYHRFARHLTGLGLEVVTYDYRGVGGSAPEELRGFEASMRDWPELDTAGVLDHVLETRGPDRLVVVGHSMGGQGFGLTPNNREVEAMLGVACVKGHWRLWPKLGHRLALRTLWSVAAPLLTGLYGYFPAGLVGLGGEDLPAGVARDWCRWGKSPHYMVDEQGRPLREHFEAYHGRLRCYSLADDWYAPYRPVQALVDLHPKARTEHVHVDPADRGVDAIGHFGFFRQPGKRAGLWDEAAGWLLEG